MNHVINLLRVSAASVLAAVPFVPYVSVGDQPYAAIGFVERVNALSDTRIIDAGWRLPPTFALVASLLALSAIALPHRFRWGGQLAAAVFAGASAALAYRFSGQSFMLTPLAAPKLLLIGSLLLFTVVAVEQIAKLLIVAHESAAGSTGV